MPFHLLAQTYTYTTQTSTSGGGIGLVWVLVYLAFIVLVLVGMWKLYVKAGQPGWASIVPFYNVYVLLQIAGKPGWWLVLYFIPVVNIVVSVLVGVEVAKKFGFSEVFGAILCGLLSIGYLIIGFGSAQYQGDGATQASSAPPPAPSATPPSSLPPAGTPQL